MGKKLSYEELKAKADALEAKEEARAKKQAERVKKWQEQQRKAGMKRIQIWVPEDLLKQEIEKNGRVVKGLVFADQGNTMPFKGIYMIDNSTNEHEWIWPPNPFKV